jgi:hypothetical protein
MARKLDAQQLELEVAAIERPEKPRERSSNCRHYLDEHVIGELRIVRRGRRILIALAELERWLDRSAMHATLARSA